MHEKWSVTIGDRTEMISADYIPTANLPDFAQEPDVDVDLLEIVSGDLKHSGHIRYRDPKTGRTWTVPNVPYNQPREIRAQYMDWQSGENTAMALKYLRNGFTSDASGANERAERYRQMAAKLREERKEVVGK